MIARCDRCRFYHANPPSDQPGMVCIGSDGVFGGGECRHMPPVQVQRNDLARFPLVASDMWCGRFEARPSPSQLSCTQGHATRSQKKAI